MKATEPEPADQGHLEPDAADFLFPKSFFNFHRPAVVRCYGGSKFRPSGTLYIDYEIAKGIRLPNNETDFAFLLEAGGLKKISWEVVSKQFSAMNEATDLSCLAQNDLDYRCALRVIEVAVKVAAEQRQGLWLAPAVTEGVSWNVNLILYYALSRLQNETPLWVLRNEVNLLKEYYLSQLQVFKSQGAIAASMSPGSSHVLNHPMEGLTWSESGAVWPDEKVTEKAGTLSARQRSILYAYLRVDSRFWNSLKLDERNGK